MVEKYTLLNVAVFKGGISAPLYKVFDPEREEGPKNFYKAYIMKRGKGRSQRISMKSFEHEHRSKVIEWREAQRGDK